MDSVRHQVHSAFKGLAEAVLPVRSAAGGFRSSGVLSPDEFVLAGDFLVATCPTWGWEVRQGGGRGSGGALTTPRATERLASSPQALPPSR